MDLRNNFIVTSKYGTGSTFETNFAAPIRVQTGHKIALKSIFYGPTFNVTANNNLLIITRTDKKQDYKLYVESGFYRDLLHLTEAISKTINSWIDDHDELLIDSEFEKAKDSTFKLKSLHHTKASYDHETDIITLDMGNGEHLCLKIDPKPNVLDLLEFDVESTHLRGYKVKNGYLTKYFPAFVYGSVIENSYINGQPSRLLAIVPFQSGFSNGNKKGYHFHEFSSPTYYNFGISEFSQIMFYILDMDGNPLEFDPDFQTILNLEVFKPLNIV